MRFLSRASVAGADPAARKLSASDAMSSADKGDDRGAAASCAATLFSIACMREGALFQRVSNSRATSRFSGSAASDCLKARSEA
jgi:hypothetical protein